MAVGKAAIIKPRWAETTLSGPLWILMAGKAPKRVRRSGLDTHRALQAGHQRLATVQRGARKRRADHLAR